METEQNCNILTPNSSGHNSISFPLSWAAQLGAQPLLGHGSHSSNFSPTDLNFPSPGLYNNFTFTYFLRASHLHSIQPVDSQGYPLISDTPVIYTGAFLILTARPGANMQQVKCYLTLMISSNICQMFAHGYLVRQFFLPIDGTIIRTTTLSQKVIVMKRYSTFSKALGLKLTIRFSIAVIQVTC